MARPRKPSLGTLNDVIAQYWRSTNDLASKTRAGYERTFREVREVWGDIPVEQITPQLVQLFIDQFADQPATQNAHLASLRVLNRWAIGRGLMPQAVCFGIKTKHSDGAREPWTAEQVALAERHARPDVARLVTLAVLTGQRISDLATMKWTDIEEDAEGQEWIHVKQRKTGLELFVPVLPALRAALDAWGRSLGYICTDFRGRQWTSLRISQAWQAERDRNPHLEPLRAKALSFHGLRATAVGNLRKAGFTQMEIAAMVGMSVQMVSRYTRKEEQRQLARAAIKRHGLEQNNIVKLSGTK